MKNRIVLSLLAGTLAMGACKLDETPYGFYSEDNFFKTAADAEAAVMYAYGTLNYLEYSRTIFFLGDMASETMTTKSDASADNHDLNNWKVGNFKTNGSLENFFKYAFIGAKSKKTFFWVRLISSAPGITLTWCVTSALFLCINQ